MEELSEVQDRRMSLFMLTCRAEACAAAKSKAEKSLADLMQVSAIPVNYASPIESAWS